LSFVGKLYLAYTDLCNGDLMFWRVLVLLKDEGTACHFLDSGKQEKLDETYFIPLPGTQEWDRLLSQVVIFLT
jgi:hypothetical protein